MGQRYRVVVVDDDPDVRTLARRALERSGRFEVVAEAADGDAGADAAAEHQPDVTLLDLNMPGTDGLTALPTIRRVAPRCTVVVLSALRGPQAASDALAAGASGFLVKRPSWRRLADDLLSVVDATEPGGGTVDGVRRRRLDLPAERTSGAFARRFLRTTLRQWDVADLLDDAELLTTELVNNAVLHATSPVSVHLRLDPPRLRVEVSDIGEGALRREQPSLEDTRGRGLLLVEALAHAWGTSAGQHGKLVWFELHLQRALV